VCVILSFVYRMACGAFELLALRLRCGGRQESAILLLCSAMSS
jgi:hypothetical protein